MLNRFRSEQAESSAGERNEFMGGNPKSLLYLQVYRKTAKLTVFDVV